MRILVQGDSHGYLTDILPKVYKAGELKIQHLLVVGDFGLWTHKADGHLFLDELNEAARINNLSVYAIGGNHENWDHWNWFIDNMPTHKGFALARRRVLLAPKAHMWKWAGKTFVGAGGAVSVDKAERLMSERGDRWLYEKYGIKARNGGPRTEWWPNEELTDEDVAYIKSFGRADYLFTHDCSDHTNFKKRLKPDADSQIHRQRIDKVLASVKPKFHFHGHMHEQYDWENPFPHGYVPFDEEYTGPFTRTIGLEAFRDFNSWGVLDVEGERWYWPKEVAEAQDRREQAVEEAKTRSESDYIVTKASTD